MKEWIRIAGAWRVPGKIVTRPANECDLPPRWLSKTRPPGPGPEVIFPTPILLRRQGGELERINWLPPRLYDGHIARADQIQVIVISEADWGPDEEEIELLRLLKHGVARVVLDERDTARRQDIIRTLYDRKDLRELLAKHVFESKVDEHQVLEPKQLGLLFSGTISRETFQADVQFAQLAPLIEQAERVYSEVRKTHPELPTMREFLRTTKRRKNSVSLKNRDTYVPDVLERIIAYQGSEQAELAKLGGKLIEFVFETDAPSGQAGLDSQ